MGGGEPGEKLGAEAEREVLGRGSAVWRWVVSSDAEVKEGDVHLVSLLLLLGCPS